MLRVRAALELCRAALPAESAAAAAAVSNARGFAAQPAVAPAKGAEDLDEAQTPAQQRVSLF
jgi:hypothetical protein